MKQIETPTYKMKKFLTMIILIKNSKTRVETQRAMKK